MFHIIKDLSNIYFLIIIEKICIFTTFFDFRSKIISIESCDTSYHRLNAEIHNILSKKNQIFTRY